MDTETQPESTEQQYEYWKQRPGPKTLTPLITSLEPIIDKALKTYGYSEDPNIRSTAQAYVIKVLPRYKPSAGAQLHTFVFNELRRLQRLGPKQQYAIPMPEQAAFDLRCVNDIEEDLKASSGREPTADELSDATGLSTNRITVLRRKYGIPALHEHAFTTEEGATNLPGSQDSKSTEAGLWLEAIYGELDSVDQKILDWSLGLHGAPQLSKTQMAVKLGISVPAITQRAKRVADKIDEGRGISVL